MKKKGDILDGIEFSKSYSDRNGQLLQVFLTSDDKYRIYRPLQDYPQAFLDTLLLQEDRFFYTHHGVNVVSVIKAGWETYIKKSRRIGASTITMQVAKLKYGIYTKSIPGKLKQIRKAIYLEMCFSKEDILDDLKEISSIISDSKELSEDDYKKLPNTLFFGLIL